MSHATDNAQVRPVRMAGLAVCGGPVPEVLGEDAR